MLVGEGEMSCSTTEDKNGCAVFTISIVTPKILALIQAMPKNTGEKWCPLPVC